MTDSLQSFLAELSQEGDVQGDASGFTLSSDKAREKLKKFALAHPENYFLLIVAGLQALGARRFELVVDADDLKVRGDCRIDRERLIKLWESVAGGDGGKADSGLRLLGLAILTSVRFEKVLWRIDSSDQKGSFRLSQSVVKERIPDPVFENTPADIQGTLISVKRRDLRGVASRFFNQLTNRLLDKEWEEERLLSERVFLGVLDSFAFNARSLDCQLQATPSLLMLKVGEPPDFLSAKHCFREPGEQSAVVVIGRNPDLPGVAKKVSWLWHGLRMGENRLGLSYDFCRAFVVADELRCDLSLTALADTWARQKAIRLAREATRRALELLAETYRTLQADKMDCQDSEMESYLLEVLSDRIDTQRNRHRLGSFNDTLVRCPFFRVSEPDGTQRRTTLYELWEEIEQGKNPALFSKPEDWRDVPAWPDRPVVIYAHEQHSEALVKIFGPRAFLDGRTVARSVESLKGSRREFEPPPKSNWQGLSVIEGQEVFWSLSLDDTVEKGRLVVLKEGRVYFEDRTLELPDGFLFYGETDWEPNFGGTLADKSLREHLSELALQEIANHLDFRRSVPSQGEIQAIGRVCRGLGPKRKRWDKPCFHEKEWLVARETNGNLIWLSPKTFWSKVGGDIPCYYVTLQEARANTGDLPLCLVMADEAVVDLPGPFHHVGGVLLHRGRPPFAFPSDGFEVVELESSCIDSGILSRIQVGFPHSEETDGQTSLEINLRGHKLQTRTVSSFVSPVTICLDLEVGWPDSRGCGLIDKERLETIEGFLPKILTEASRRLLVRMSPSEFCGLNQEVQRTLTIDLWSDGELDTEARIPTSEGGRVSFAQLHSHKQVRYFSDIARAKDVPSGTVFLTSAQVEALKMVTEIDDWVDELSALEHGLEATTTTTPESLPATILPSPVSSSSPRLEPVARGKSVKKKSPEPSEQEPVTELPLSLPQAKVEVPIDHVKPSETTPLLSQARNSHRPCSTVEALCALLGKIAESSGKVPLVKEFGLFLASVQEESDLNSALVDVQGKPVVRSVAEPPPDFLLCLLSALYSFFNRSLERVEDKHEREFHRKLVRYASRR